MQPSSFKMNQSKKLNCPEVGGSSAEDIPSRLQERDLSTPGIHFPDGIVKKTWARGYPRSNDIKIEEVLQKDDLQLAVLSAFQWDDEWILSKLDMTKTKIMCVVQAENDTQVRTNLQLLQLI